MGYRKHHPQVILSDVEQTELTDIRNSRSRSVRHVTRAAILLLCAQGHSKSSIAQTLSVSLQMVNSTVRRAQQVGALEALDDLPRTGKPPVITPEPGRGWWRWLVKSRTRTGRAFVGSLHPDTL